MKNVIETDRLLLRELTLHDAENFYHLNLNSNVIRYTGDSSFGSIEEALSFLKNYKDYEENGFGRWAVIDQSNDEFLGWSGLKYNKQSEEIDIGFRFFEQHWNKGFATESAKACLDYGFNILNMQRIIGRVMRQNISSIKVLEKIGLVYQKEFDFKGYQGLIYEISCPTNLCE